MMNNNIDCCLSFGTWCQQAGLGQAWERGAHHLLFYCHITAGDLAPGFCSWVLGVIPELGGMVVAGGDVSRWWWWWFLWVVVAISVCGHPFTFILGCSLSFGWLSLCVGGCLHSLGSHDSKVVVVVVGVGCHVMVVVHGIIGLWWLLKNM